METADVIYRADGCAGTAGGRFLCPQTVCRRSLSLTSPHRSAITGSRTLPTEDTALSSSRETHPKHICKTIAL